MDCLLDQLSFNNLLSQQNSEMLGLEMQLEETKRKCIQKKIDEIPQMSNRQLLEEIYKLLLQQE